MPSRKDFLDRVVSLLADRFPGVETERDDEEFALRIDGFWASMENLYRIVASRPEDLEERVEEWVVEMLRAGRSLPEEEDAVFQNLRWRILPMVMADKPPEIAAASIVHQQLISGLAVAYAIDGERSITYIPPKLFQSWSISLDELHDAALANLARRSETLSAQAAEDEEGRVSMIIVQVMDGYDASRILLPGLHGRLREYLGSPFLAGIPNRDILLCVRNDPDTVERVGPQVAHDYRTMPHSISDRLFLVTADGIAPYTTTL
jgi:uncharacterized protein YtpQ (UPF0354 family)